MSVADLTQHIGVAFHAVDIFGKESFIARLPVKRPRNDHDMHRPADVNARVCAFRVFHMDPPGHTLRIVQIRKPPSVEIVNVE